LQVSEEAGLKCIIPALTPVPVKRVQVHTVPSQQSDVTVELYEADGDSCGAPLLFGKVKLSLWVSYFVLC